MVAAMSERLRIDQIAVTLDADSENVLALGVAAQMAKLLGARLHGVFVEDPGLLLAISQPVTRHVTALANAPIELDLATLEAHWRVMGNRLRDALRAIALENQLPWSFLTVRDNPARLSVDAGLLIVEMATRPAVGQWRPASRLLESAYRGAIPVLLVRHGLRRHCVVTLVVDTLSPSAVLALNWAANIAGERGDQLHLLVRPSSLTRNMVEEWLARFRPGLAATAEISHMRPAVTSVEWQAPVGRKGDLLVIDAADDMDSPNRIKALVLATEGDVLLVR
jgi:hypothetical protein